jgi:hypothetical protein
LGKTPQSNADLVKAFPSRLRIDAYIAFSALPENPNWFNTFSLLVDGENVSIPRRVYHDVSLVQEKKLDNLQRELILCILTRHCDGFQRQHYLSRVINSNHIWIPPFVIQLLGEYVVEIIRVIDENLMNLDASLYSRFLQSNPSFLALTEQRVNSYWDCYYRSVRKDEYPGFRVLGFLKNLVARTN